MAPRYELYRRLEPDPQQRSFAAGFAAAVFDPVWFLARQWLMGEHQGENASSPVLVSIETADTELQPTTAAPSLNPTVVPVEAIVEAEPDGWWTMGRRVRLGRIMAERLGLTRAGAPPGYLFTDPPPPYELLSNRFDGRALWADRATLDPTGTRFGGLGIPSDRAFLWQSSELVYEATFPLAGQQDGRSLRLPRHRGGEVDWLAADAIGDAAAPFEPANPVVETTVYPARLRYPGAPLDRWWEIEDAAVDLGGYPPDTSHFPTTLLLDLVASHGDDWFLFPVDARVGRVLTIASAVVTDAFGETFELTPPEDDWHLFKTTGLDARSLVVWLRAMTPLEGQPIENVLLGLDEYSNVLWAVERRMEGREAVPRPRDPTQEALNPTRAQPDRTSGVEPPIHYVYVPGQNAAQYWHAYQVESRPNAAGGVSRRFVQRRLADLERVHPELLPPPVAQVLRPRSAAGEVVHEIEPATIPSIGIEIDRRYQLARDLAGRPMLWLQRRRMPFLAPPSRALRFDVLAEEGKEA